MRRDGREPTPFGAWASPISARDVAEGARRIDDIAAAGDDVCWIERRPEEGGRNVLVRRGVDGETRTLTPEGFDVRSRVHEYGGGAFCLLCPPPPAGAPPPLGAPAFWPASAASPRSGGHESPPDLPHVFVNFQDQRVYLATSATTPPTPFTRADGAHYADLVFDPHRHRLIAVQERPNPGGGEELAALVAIPLPAAPSTDPTSDPPPPTELVSGADFYSSPRLSPDGARLAWLSWNHPDMPWDAAELRLADLDVAGRPVASRPVAGGDPEAPEAVQQPSFDAHGRLTFISDRTGWWNLYRLDVDDAVPPLGAPAFHPMRPRTGARTGSRVARDAPPGFRPASGALPQSGEPEPPAHPLHPRAAEFGVPPWLFGMSSYAHTASGIVAACCEQGVWSLLFLPESGPAVPIPTPYTSITWLRPVVRPTAPDAGQKAGAPSGLDAVLFLGVAPDRPAELVRLSLPAGGAPSALEVLATTGPSPDPRYISRGRPIDFPSPGGRRAFAFFYPPKNDDALPPAGVRPPLIVKSHGGPTSAAEHVYDTGVQYWTSRGFAVVDVNYGGSTGYGRAYRESLRDRWGIVDVEDCAAAAEALAARGEVDPRQLLIRGGSAGGYTTLAALAFKDTFAAGASHYGVADLSALARDTHKFESRYLDRLVGPYPERSDLYDERSPLSARDGFSCPVIFFQGAEDRIVPPNQAESMVEALRARGVPVAYLLFEGEQHGFRRAGNIVRALEAELSFYGQVLGFEPAGPIEPVTLLGPA